jgi:hypothetical protein
MQRGKETISTYPVQYDIDLAASVDDRVLATQLHDFA